ncbi:hypothetical protein O6H91_02G135700 [Diphasiastrum complanatum]|uniref:Uncharacterized protein n=2 Tax=Diphasiastrum complanatum TaxID=34168 RepID=A0ACC2ELE5_DIPCM|nr:hypothetical protein O6H91_02G135300 [Diphasiastrum complanatum]KAJ7567191.1 hypothetical protein O6H91_02G135700 [Diphasiastrum complanatum]
MFSDSQLSELQRSCSYNILKHNILQTMQNDNQSTHEWESRLPSMEELTPLTQSLISPELAIAFRIGKDAHKNEFHSTLSSPAFHADKPTDQVNRALAGNNQANGDTEGTRVLIPPFYHSQRQQLQGFRSYSSQFEINLLKNKESDSRIESGLFGSIVDGLPYELQQKKLAGKIGHGVDEEDGKEEVLSDISSKKGQNQVDGMDLDEADLPGGAETSGEEMGARTLKRPRLVWTPQLHKRFVDAVAHLGIKNAVPKTIMQLMNVEGLTRENVASHLQKYRLYLKRVQGLSTDGLSSSDPLFNTSPVPPTISSSAHFLPHSRNDSTAPPLAFMASPMLPLSLAGFKQAHVGSSLQGGGQDDAAFIARARALAHHSSSAAVEHQEKVSTSSQGVLTLFPMSSR